MTFSRRSLFEGAAGLLLAAPARSAPAPFADAVFFPILEGYLRNAARTSPSLAVCDFPDVALMPGSSWWATARSKQNFAPRSPPSGSRNSWSSPAI